MIRKILIISGLFLLLPVLVKAERTDFLILKNLGSLEVLNQYEQPLSNREKREFNSNSPLQIIEEETSLGDGITTAMEVNYDDKVYYLLGDLKNKGRRYKRCKIPEVTDVQAGGDLRYTQGITSGGRSGKVEAGTFLQLVFTYKNLAYVKRIDESDYVWVSARGPWKKKKKRKTSQAASIGSDLKLTLTKQIESANKTYEKYITAFNDLTGENYNPPRWKCVFSDEGMSCTLRGKGISNLKKSTKILVRDLRQSLTSRSYTVSSQGNEINVEPSEKGDSKEP